jgi:hypothetical protein
MTNNQRKEISALHVLESLRRLSRIVHGVVPFRFGRLVLLVFAVLVLTPAVVDAQRDSSAQSQRQSKDPEQPNIDGLVEVSFRVDETGRIQIVHINSTSTQLTEYVVKKLMKIKLNTDSGSEGKVITYRFVFKKQA